MAIRILVPIRMQLLAQRIKLEKEAKENNQEVESYVEQLPEVRVTGENLAQALSESRRSVTDGDMVKYFNFGEKYKSMKGPQTNLTLGSLMVPKMSRVTQSGISNGIPALNLSKIFQTETADDEDDRDDNDIYD